MKKFLIPSKTFLLGEYIALSEGIGLVATHSPYFTVTASTQFSTVFSPLSPAGKYQLQHKNSFQFSDPHNGQGGFGCSGAECIAVALANTDQIIDPWTMKNLFHEQGSGLDILAQSYGVNQSEDQVLYINKQTREIRKMPLLGLWAHIFHTQKKLATHEHLKHINHSAFESLVSLFEDALNAWENRNFTKFLEQSYEYQKTMAQLGLLAKHSQIALADLVNRKDLLGAKACGAMGSDTLVVYTKTREHSLQDWQEKHSFLEIHQFPV